MSMLLHRTLVELEAKKAEKAAETPKEGKKEDKAAKKQPTKKKE